MQNGKVSHFPSQNPIPPRLRWSTLWTRFEAVWPRANQKRVSPRRLHNGRRRQPRIGIEMCGRYYRRSDKQRIAEAFKVGKLPAGFELPPDYNIAPSTFQPVIRTDRETGERELTMMRWGLVPAKVADPTASRSSPLQMRDRNRFSKRVSGKERSLILVAWFHLTAST